MDPRLRPTITPGFAGKTIPDLVRVSVFADYPTTRAIGNITALTAHAHRYFMGHPGAIFSADVMWVGPGYILRVGDVTCKFGISKSFSMSASFNPQRLVARREGLSRWDDPGGGNTVLPLLTKGMSYDRAGLRRGMCEDIVDLVDQAKAAYARIVPKALGVDLEGLIHANFSRLELDLDFSIAPSIIDSYSRAFGKVIRPTEASHGLSGKLRNGEGFRIYSKPPVHSAAPVVRFEITIAGERIRKITDSQRVPDSADGVAKVLDAVDARYVPIWVEIERHRLTPSKSVTSLIYKMPRFKGRDEVRFHSMARQLARQGRIRATKRNRAKLTTLAKKGLVENLRPLTKVRGVRVTTPTSEALWELWGPGS